MTETSPKLNREGWLTAFAERIAPVIKQRTGNAVPLRRVRLSCSFPRSRATPNRSGGFTTGQCFHADTHQSGLHEIFINPLVSEGVTDDGRGIMETVTHELLHASLPKGVGHKAPFARAAKAMGLEGKPTSTEAGEGLIKLFREIESELGPYPHEALQGEWGTKQTTRLLKVLCPACGYVIRVTGKWIDTGLPICPCGEKMVFEADQDRDPLTVLENHVIYRYSDRFAVRYSRQRGMDSWVVIDYMPETRTHTLDDGTTVQVPKLGESMPRIVGAEGRQDALDMITSVEEGLFTWDDLEDNQDALENEPDTDFLEDDEDETADYEDSILTPEEEAEYDKMVGIREASGARTSAKIASGAERALD